jgi:hypothetical protein
MAQQPIVLDYRQLKEYFFENKHHLYYSLSVDKYKEFLPHSDGEYPKDVIERQRPNEPMAVKDFRKEIWEPITKPKFTQIVSSLGKIRRSSDWAIKYPEEAKELTKISEEETLQKYCEEEFPYFKSVTNWVFSVLMKFYLIDPNAVMLVMPLESNVDPTEYIKPYPYLFNCEDVFDFVPEKYAVIRNPLGSSLYKNGKSFYVVTESVIELWEQVSARNFEISDQYFHGLGFMPAFKLGGIITKSHGHNFLYESRISGILPSLNEAIAEYTDLQAAKRLHIYPERWEFSQNQCTTCKGAGTIRNSSYTAGSGFDPIVRCNDCGGLGVNINSGPYSKVIVKPTDAGMAAIPTPPAGFIEKDVEIVKIMDESWRKHIYDGLASINFQFLDKSPLNQSGLAKEVDKEELNNTVHLIAEDIVAVMDKFYKSTAHYRYKDLYSSEEIDTMLPSIPVPDHFDLLSSQFMQEEVAKAKTSKLHPTIVSAMEIEYTGKRFINEPEVKDRLELILRLDPLPNITEEEKMTRLSNKGITQLNYIISSNIQSFVQRAIDEIPDFASKSLPEQIKVMEKYAQAQIDAAKAEVEEMMQRQIELIGNQPPETGDPSEEDEEEPVLEPENV